MAKPDMKDIVCRKMQSKWAAAALRRTVIALVAVVGLLCAPFVQITTDQPEREQIPALDNQVDTPSRVDVQLRRGDTLASVLKRFSVEAPSAHALIDKVRPFVNPRKIRPGDNIQVVLSAEDRTLQAMGTVDDNRCESRQPTTVGRRSVTRYLSCARPLRARNDQGQSL
jgi:hypothetical protein